MGIYEEGLESLEKRIAALEKEQLLIKKYVKDSIRSNEELIRIVKKLRGDIKSSEPINTNGTKLTS